MTELDIRLYSTVEGYTDGLWDAHRKVEAAGYELEVRRNSWSSEEYKGINTRWFDPASEKLFEIQLHTQDSWEAKQQTHQAYEKMKDPRTPPAEVDVAARISETNFRGSPNTTQGARYS